MSAAADEAFDHFVRSNASALLRSAFVLTGNRATAEDLLQDALANLYLRWHQVSAAHVPLAYVRRAIANHFVTMRRARGGHDLIVSDVPDGWDGHNLDDDVALRDTIWHLLTSLPPKQRAAIALRFYDDLTDDQIASAIGCRPATVRSLISRGLGSMRSGFDRDPMAIPTTENLR